MEWDCRHLSPEIFFTFEYFLKFIAYLYEFLVLCSLIYFFLLDLLFNIFRASYRPLVFDRWLTIIIIFAFNRKLKILWKPTLCILSDGWQWKVLKYTLITSHDEASPETCMRTKVCHALICVTNSLAFETYIARWGFYCNTYVLKTSFLSNDFSIKTLIPTHFF